MTTMIKALVVYWEDLEKQIPDVKKTREANEESVVIGKSVFGRSVFGKSSMTQ